MGGAAGVSQKRARPLVIYPTFALAAGDDVLVSEKVPREVDMSDENIKEELERLRAENERLKKRSSRGVTMKVSEKGGLSVYGLGRFPVTLYKEQWIRLLDMAEDIKTFIRENEGTLKSKDAVEREAAEK
jgi:hypothetical protein